VPPDEHRLRRSLVECSLPWLVEFERLRLFLTRTIGDSDSHNETWHPIIGFMCGPAVRLTREKTDAGNKQHAGVSRLAPSTNPADELWTVFGEGLSLRSSLC
jgi:hypothetical protein